MDRADLGQAIRRWSDPDRVLEACAEASTPELAELDQAIAPALAGDPAAIRAYVSASRRLIQRLLRAVHESQPDLAIVMPDGLEAVDGRESRGSFLESFSRRTWVPDAGEHGYEVPQDRPKLLHPRENQ